MPRRLIFGCGYLGLRVAQRWLASGDRVVAVTRWAERAAFLQQLGLRPLVADVTRPDTLTSLPAADTVLYAVAPDRTSGASPDQVVVQGLNNVLHALAPRSGRIVYISTTGVYGDHQGGWVDESTPCEPSRPGAGRYLQAENLLRAHDAPVQRVILRLAGIYGPQRVPNLRQLASGEPIAAWPERFLNLIHVDDAVEAIDRAASHDRPSPLYLVSDGHPVRRRAFYEHVATLWHTPPPRFAPPEAPLPEAPPPVARQMQPAEPRPGQRAQAAAANPRRASGDDRRILNRLMVHELGVRLRYPSYREGLAAIRAAESFGPATS